MGCAAALTADCQLELKGDAMTEKSSAAVPGTVEKIMKAPFPGEPERAQIFIEGSDHSCQEIRIENTLIDENNAEVHLKAGAKVRVTVRSRTADDPCPGK
jgi:hypothetical protein